jgi:aarF domain-containing kinase
VPKVFVATEGVLVTTIAEGVSLSKFVREDHSKAVKQVVFEALTDLMARMVLVDNFIHGDLHPGNFFISTHEPEHGEPNATSDKLVDLMHGGRPLFDKPLPFKITLIDAGISLRMSKSLTTMMRDSMRAAFNMNSTALGTAIVQLHVDEGLCTHAKDLEGLEEILGKLMLAGAFMCRDKRIWGAVFHSWKEYRSSHVSDYFGHMLGMLSEHKVRISPSLWSIMTALALIEGSIQELGFGVNVLRSATPYLFRGTLQRWRRRRFIETSESLHKAEEL